MFDFVALLLILISGVPHGTKPSAARLAELDARLNQRDELRRLVRAGKHVEAIRLYRRETGATLVEAKTAVDRVRAELRPGGP